MLAYVPKKKKKNISDEIKLIYSCDHSPLITESSLTSTQIFNRGNVEHLKHKNNDECPTTNKALFGYDIVPFHFGSKKWYGEGLGSHGYRKNQAVCSKTGPEIGRYGKVNQKLGRYDIVPFRSRVNRSGTISYRFPDLFGIYG